MNIEITDLDMILNYLETTSLESHDNYSSEFTYKDQKILYKYIKQLQQENQELKEHLKVPENCTLKTLEDYKNYYEDTTKEQILEDNYRDYCAYVNLAHRYSELKKQLEEYQKALDEIMSEKIDIENNWNKLKEFALKKKAIVFNTEYICYSNIIDKMQEIEGNDSNE